MRALVFAASLLSLQTTARAADEVFGNADTPMKAAAAQKVAGVACKLDPQRHLYSLAFTVHADGKVTDVTRQPGPMIDGEACALEAVARWSFGAQKAGDRSFNLIFESGVGAAPKLVQLDVGAIEKRSDRSEPTTGVSKEEIRKTIRTHLNEIKYCYEKELVKKPDLAGKVNVQFTIAPSGVVSGAVVFESTIASEPVESCITQRVRKWTFPKPTGGGIVVVRYPFVLKAAGAD